MCGIVKTWKGQAFERLCFNLLQRGVSVQGLNTSPRRPFRPETNRDCFDKLQTLAPNDGIIVQAPPCFPVVDYFTSKSELYNAKGGSSPATTSNSAVVEFLVESGLATKDPTCKLRMKDEDFKATLTFMRSGESTAHSMERAKRNADSATGAPLFAAYGVDMTNPEVEALFRKHFTPKFVNVLSIPSEERNEVVSTLQHYGFNPDAFDQGAGNTS
jgi:hypothetical protein